MSDFDPTEFARQLRTCRQRSAYTLEKAARLAGIEPVDLALAEAGQLELPFDVVMLFSLMYGISLDDLADLSSPPPPRRRDQEDHDPPRTNGHTNGHTNGYTNGLGSPPDS